MEITLDKNWTIIMIRWELNPETCNQYIYIYIYIYIYLWDYDGHQLRLKSAQVHHHSPAGTFTRAPGGVFIVTDPPGPR